MSTWVNADLLVDMLDRQRDFVLGHSNELRILSVPGWLTFVLREAQLYGLAQELLAEVRIAVDELRRADDELRQEVATAWAPCRELLQRMLLPHLHERQLHAYCRFEKFEERLASPSRVGISDDGLFDEHPTQSSKLLLAVKHWVEWTLPRLSSQSTDATHLEELRVRVAELLARQQFSHRKRITLDESSPGAAFHRLTRLAGAMNPPPPAGGGDLEDRATKLLRHAYDGEFANQLYGEEATQVRQLQGDSVTERADTVHKDLVRVTHELQLRLLAGRSRLALLNRYADRCQRFDAAELQELALKNPGKVEAELTRDFAKYLFDQGLTPILEHSVGRARADVTGMAPSNLLYVEAKQYGDAGARAVIRAAYRQVWRTWGLLRSSFAVPEAFLLVFRVDGPRAELPPVLRYRDLRLYTVLVDIAPLAASQERHTPISFSDLELLPPDAPTDDVMDPPPP